MTKNYLFSHLPQGTTCSDAKRQNTVTTAVVILLSVAVLGCHQVPQNHSANWSAGMKGYSTQDEEVIRQWRRAATGIDADAVQKIRFEEVPSKSEPKKLSLMKRMFRHENDHFTENAVLAPPLRAPRQNGMRSTDVSEGLCYDGHLLPLEMLPMEKSCPGKTIPFPTAQAEIISPSRLEPVSDPLRDHSPVLAVDPLDLNPVSTMEGTIDPMSEAAAITTTERLQPIDFTDTDQTKPVGLTQKSFGDEKEETPDPLPERPEGKIEWSDEVTEEDETVNDVGDSNSTADSTEQLTEPIRIASLTTLTERTPTDLSQETFPAPPFPTPLPDFDKVDDTDSQRPPKTYKVSGGTETVNENDWRTATEQAVRLLQAEIDRKVKSGEICSSEEACLRLLLLSTGNIPGAAQKIAGTNPALQEFWEKECRGLGRLIDAQATASNDLTVTASVIHELRGGINALQAGVPITIQKSLFVKESAPFGYYQEIPAEFTPGQTVYAYYELDNVVCKPTDTGHEIAVFCRREILDATNHPIIDPREKLCDGRSASPLNDIVLNLSVELPKSLPAGVYTLKTTFLDKNGTAGVPAARVLKFNVK